jgi:hypothetical protein
MWVDLLDACEEFLRAGFQSQFHSDVEVQTALRDWYRAQRAEHEQALLRLMREFDRRDRGHGS